jgi:hypothetical protein
MRDEPVFGISFGQGTKEHVNPRRRADPIAGPESNRGQPSRLKGA